MEWVIFFALVWASLAAVSERAATVFLCVLGTIALSLLFGLVGGLDAMLIPLVLFGVATVAGLIRGWFERGEQPPASCQRSNRRGHSPGRRAPACAFP